MGCRSVSELVRHVGRGADVEYLYFWGHQPKVDGRVAESCLSQWWPARFTVEEIMFSTAEQYMMWRKAMLFGDEGIANEVLAASGPSQAKKLGRKILGFDDRVWQEHRFDIVVRGNEAKFGQNEELRQYLVGTGDRVLVEASPVDAVWGVGLAVDDPAIVDPVKWRGRNLLGFALMDVRERS